MKKNVPIIVLEKIMPVIEEYKLLLTAVNDESVYIHLKDADPKSKLFFKLSQENEVYIVEKNPLNEATNKVGTVHYRDINDAIRDFTTWLKILDRYKIKTILDDPILEGHKKNFYNEFRFAEEDADEAPFDFKRIELLEEYLTEVSTYLSDEIENASKVFKDNLLEVYSDCGELKDDLPLLSKNKIISRLSEIWSKLMIGYYPALKVIFHLFKDKFIEKLIEKGIEGGLDLIG